MTQLVGNWVPVTPDDEFACPDRGCGKIVRGRLTPGPRGGKTWCWRLPDGTRTCSPECGLRMSRRQEAVEIDDEAQFDRWMAEQD